MKEITSFLVLFGEITPKVYANQNAVKFSLWMANPLILLRKIFYPFSYILVSSTSIIENRLKKNNSNVNIEEISKALDLTDEQHEGKEGKILRSIVEFGNTDVKEIMKSRVDVIAVDKDTKYSELLKIITSSGFSRIPVYDKQFDNILGILYIKDLIPYLSNDNDFKWLDLCRAPFFVPENKMILDIELNENKLSQNEEYIIWNGPLGIFEIDKFSNGTKQLIAFLENSKSKVIAGGGETLFAINKFSDMAKFHYVSTAGGAFLEYLTGNKLPSIEALRLK